MLGRAVRARPLFRSLADLRHPSCPPLPRKHFSTSREAYNVKPSMANIAEIRRILPGTTLVKAKESLLATSNDIQAAISWLEKDSAISGAKKASKVQDRQAKEGGIGIAIIVDGGPSARESSATELPVTTAAKAGIVELNCETDFVGRNEIFQALLADLSHTVALFPTLAMSDASTSTNGSSSDEMNPSQLLVDIPIKALLDFPLLPRDPLQQQGSSSRPRTIGSAILDVISRLSENISISRASALSNSTIPDATAPRRSETDSNPFWLIASAFTHGGVSSTSNKTDTPLVFCSTGRVGSLLLSRFEEPKLISRRDDMSLAAMRGMAKSLARQAAGMPTETIRGNDDSSLYNQSFIMKLKSADLQEQVDTGQIEATGVDSVQQVLSQWGKTWTGDKANAEAVSVLQLRRWELGEERGIHIE